MITIISLKLINADGECKFKAYGEEKAAKETELDKATLSDMREIFGGERRISLCRELTKLNEEVVRTTLKEAKKYYEDNEPRGEYVLILEGAAEAGVATEEENPLLSLSPEQHVAHYENQGMKRMDAIKAAAKDRGMPKSDLYKILNT